MVVLTLKSRPRYRLRAVVAYGLEHFGFSGADGGTGARARNDFVAGVTWGCV
jgi:hypothetical protein